MNIHLSITLNNIRDVSGNAISFQKTSVNILLYPYYAMEEDIVPPFMNEVGLYRTALQKIVHEGSIEVDKVLPERIIKMMPYSKEDIFYYKREYVIAYATYNFATIFHRDYTRSYSKEKFLADLKVSEEIGRDPFLIKQIGEDAKARMQKIAQMARDFNGPEMAGFVKSRLAAPKLPKMHRPAYPTNISPYSAVTPNGVSPTRAWHYL